MTDERFKFVPYSKQKAEEGSDSNYSYWGSVFYYFAKKKVTLIFVAIFVILFIMALICPEVGKYNIGNLSTDMGSAFMSPNSEFWFGTDNIGQDYWCQVWYASRISILLALLVSLGQIVLGVAFGLVWGYVDALSGIFQFVFNVINNIPTIILLTLVSMFAGQGFATMTIALILIGWTSMAREVRNIVLMLKDREFNVASRCLGTSTGRILVKNILPQLVSVIVLQMALSIPSTIAMESTLSFLGLGLDVNTPSLGILLRNARLYFLEYPHMLIFPAVIISLITVTFYMVGNAFADASDPKNHR